jgi:flagellar basal-body rod protein FlgB
MSGTPNVNNFLGIHGTALALREQRLQLLAANLANADTPGFKAQDLDFNAALDAALRPGAGAATGVAGAAAIDAAVSAGQFARAPTQASLDGNTVEGETEKAAFAQAALEYRASMSFVESKVRSMLTAITGQ